MGFLDSTVQIVNATLTKKGRSLLAKGDPNFRITKFALGDDEIDYVLWNSNHVSGSDYYGEAIEMTPVFEALPDETIVMRYKLITLPKNVTTIPYVVVAPLVMTLQYSQRGVVKPSTLNGSAGYDDRLAGYTCILHNQAIATLEAERTAPNQPTGISRLPSDVYDDATAINSVYAIGLTFTLTAKDVTAIASSLRSSIITVIGNESAGRATLTLTVEVPPTPRIRT